MGHTRSINLFWTLVFLMILLPKPTVFSLSNPFLELPGDLSALAGGPVNLTWVPTFNESNIAWCYWEYADCMADPDTVSKITECPPDEFIGYVYETKARQNISSRHEGWSFLNKSSPCKGGLHRTMLEHKHAGWYRMNVYTSANVTDEKLPLIKQTSIFSTLHVYNEIDVQVWLQIGDMTESQIPLQNGKNGTIELEPQILTNRNVSMKVWNIFPPETEVIFKQHEFGLDQVNLYIEQCTGHHKRSCNVIIMEEKNDVVYIIELDTRIQGYPKISIEQRCTFKEVDPEDDVDPPSNSSSSESYPWWVVPLLSVIIVLLVIGVIVLAVIFLKGKDHEQVCSKRKKRRRKQQKYQAANPAANGKISSADAKPEEMKCLNGSIPEK